jgi:heme/copper-type cytochrome/quinol oxidase subunit 2
MTRIASILPLGGGPGVLAWLGVASGLLMVVSLVSIWKAHAHSRRARIVWTVIAVLVPIVGPVAWLVAGRASHHRPPLHRS